MCCRRGIEYHRGVWDQAKELAIAQGIATLPVADGVANLSTSVSVVFNRAAPFPGSSCGDSWCILPGSFAMAGSEVNATTAATVGAEPSVSWPCETRKTYTMIMWDAFGAEYLRENPGGGFLHWLKTNIPCGREGVADGRNTGELLSAYVPPGNPNTAPNNYGFYIYEQTRQLNQSQTAAQRGHLAVAGHRRNLPAILRALGGVIDRGPIARNWAWLSVSPFSPVLVR